MEEFYYLSASIITLLIYLNAFKDGKPTCKSYLINTYLYVVLGLLIVGYVSLITSKYQKYQKNQKNPKILVGSFMLSIFCMIGMFVSTTNTSISRQTATTMSHVFWILLVICLGYSISASIKTESKNVLTEAFILTTIVFISMTVVSFIVHDSIKTRLPYIGIILTSVLLSAILFELYYIFVKKERKIQKKYSYLMILLFSAFLVYDTSRIRENALECSITNPANYPMESTSLILDLINIFELSR